MLDDIVMKFDIASRVNIHDIYQFEIKLEYNLARLQETNNYKIETFFFIPHSLQINQNTYPKEEFYKDLQNYIRFKTPSYSLKLLLDPAFDKSPFFVIRDNFNKIKLEKDYKKRIRLFKGCIKELKLLGVMVRVRLRDVMYFIERSLEEPEPKLPYLVSRLERLFRRSVAVLEYLRELFGEFRANFPEEKELFKYFRTVEEFLSGLIEEEFVRMFQILKKKLANNFCFDALSDQFKEFCVVEKQKRAREGFELIIGKDELSKERYIHHMVQYKKMVASVLYLDILREKGDVAYSNLIGASAAFSASMVYFLLTFFISKNFALNSFPFILLLSLGYVFKDRIKEYVKLILNPSVLSKFPDHITKIRDISEEGSVKLGEIREKCFHTTKDKIDPLVLEYRDKTRPSLFLPEEEPEDIMVYQKEININTADIRKTHTRTVNLTDIMRFNVHKYLEKMDDAVQPIYYYDEEEGKMTSALGDRTYHVNLVLKYSEFRENAERIRYERYRVVLNKLGIQRVESIEV